VELVSGFGENPEGRQYPHGSKLAGAVASLKLYIYISSYVFIAARSKQANIHQ